MDKPATTIKRVIICGKAASGKDYLRDEFRKQRWKINVSVTTRPKRLGEENNAAYHFVTKERFDELIRNNELREHTCFNGWHYGTLMSHWEKSQVFIMTPSGISQLTKNDRAESLIVFLDIDSSDREKRLALRNDADSIKRRLEADEKDFIDFHDYDIGVCDSSFSSEQLCDIAKTVIKS